MALKELLMSQLKEAMKSKDAQLRDTVQLVRAGVLQVEKDSKTELDDSGVIDVVVRELKKCNDVLPDYERSGRADAIADLNRRIDILKSYLPQQLSEDEARAVVKETLEAEGLSSPRDMGAAMKAVSPKLKGRADSRLVSELVKSFLNK